MEEKIKNVKNENVKKVEEVELEPTWSKLKSFHGKAMIGTNDKGNKYLKSFGFLVCEIIKGEVKIHNEVNKWDSKSTIRHINNFLFENGFETGNTNELTELYITKTKKIEKKENKEETKKVTTEKSKIENKKAVKKDNKTAEAKIEKTKIEDLKIQNTENKVEAGA